MDGYNAPFLTRNGESGIGLLYTKWELKVAGTDASRANTSQAAPKMVHTARLPNPSCTMDQTKLENQPEMVHSARMDLPSCSMDQKVSQSLPRLGNILLDDRLAVSHGDKTREGNERIEAEQQNSGDQRWDDDNQ